MEALLGFAIALVVGLTGMGGGPLAAPLLMLVLGVPPMEAVGTSLLFVTITKASAAVVYCYRRQVQWNLFFRLLGGGAPGVLLGTLFLQKMSRDPRLQPIVLATIGLVIASLALLNLYRSLRRRGLDVREERPKALSWVAFPIGLEVGFSSAGAGALTGLALMHFTKLEAAKIVGTDLLFGLAIAALGGSVHLATGNLNQHLLLALSAILLLLGHQLLWKGLASLAR